MRCFFCGAPSREGEKIFRTSLCEGCGRELRICRDCSFYSPGAQWECRERIAEPVYDKERANFCDYFRPAPSSSQGRQEFERKGKDARASFDKLFGNS